MKKISFKFYLLSSVIAVPAILLSCGAKTDEVKETKVSPNFAISLGNIKGTIGQVQGVLTNVVNGLNEAIKSDTSETNTTQKEALTELANSLNAELWKLSSRNNQEGALIAKITNLNSNSTDYLTKLEDVDQDLKKVVKAIETAFTKFNKDATASETKPTDQESLTSVRNLKSLKTFFGNYKTVKMPSATLLDLARLFEAFQGNVANTLLAKFTDKTTANYLNTGLLASQIFNLLVKRELQTIAMARVIALKALTNEEIQTSVAKVNTSQTERLNLAKLPTVFVGKVKALETKFNAFKTLVTDYNTKKSIQGVSLEASDTTKATEVSTKLETLVNLYFGSQTLIGPDFVKPGLKSNVIKLNEELKVLPQLVVEDLNTFDNLFQKASPTWSKAAGSFVNSLVSKNTVASLITDLTDLKTKVKTKEDAANTEETKKPYKDLGTSIDSLLTALNEFKTEFDTLAAFSVNANSAQEVSAWKLNQNVRGISSLVQIYLLQIAVDKLGLTADEYAVGLID